MPDYEITEDDLYEALYTLDSSGDGNNLDIIMGLNKPRRTMFDSIKGVTLRNRPIISDNPTRICDNCFFYYLMDHKDCGIPKGKSKEYFNVNKNEILHNILDGEKVGNFCPYFYRNED